MADSVINTFDKGLNQDTSYLLQPNGTYRNMKNGMLISYDGNHYTVEMAKGNKILLTLNPRYLETNNSSATLLDNVPMAIGFCSFIDKLIVFSTNGETTGSYGEIGMIRFTKINDDFIGVYTPYYNHKDLNFSKAHQIESFSFRENDNIERIYWTDNFNEPRVLNLKDPTFTTYITSGNLDFITPKTYMVLGGIIQHNGFRYGPSPVTLSPAAPPQINGNIFTAVNANYTIISGSPLVIEYYYIELLNWSPNRLLGTIEFSEYGIGSKNCGDSIYFYRLSSTQSGLQTSWSYASTPIHTGMNNETAFLTGVAYRDFVGNGSLTTLSNSGKSIKLNVSNIDTNFNIIELACAEFDQETDIPYSINIIAKQSITGNSMIIEDIGNVNLGIVTISDLTLFPASLLKVKTITTNKNYIIAANITEREEFDIDLSTVAITTFEYNLLAHGDLALCANANIPIDQSPVPNTNPIAGSVKPWSRWLVTVENGTTDTITYNGISYSKGQVIVASSLANSIVFTGGAQVRPATTKNKYTAISDGNRREDAIELKTAFWDYKDPAVASHNRGYWSGERYRFGILFFDKKGNPFYVKYLKDVDIPEIAAKGGLMRSNSYGGGQSWSMQPSAVKLFNLNIPESIINNISGFSIVRAERDQRIVTQGLLTQTVVDVGPTPNHVFPIGTMKPSLSIGGTFTMYDDVYSFLCPDDMVSYNYKKPIGLVGSPMEEAGWINGNMFKTEGDYHNVYTKMFSSFTADIHSPRQFNLQSLNGSGFIRYNEFNGNNNFDGSGRDYYNRYSDVLPMFGGILDTACATNLPIWTTSNGIETVGCKKIIIKGLGIQHYSTTNLYGSATAAAQTQKLLVNCLSGISKSNQYGGQSPSALSNTLYLSTGHFQPIDTLTKLETLNGTFTSGKYIGQNKYTFNDVEIFGGDCFTNLIDLGYGLWDDNFNATQNAMSYAIWFPCECNSNYNLRRGLKVSNKDMYPSGNMGWNVGGSVNLEDFSYNLGYSTEGDFIKYPALPQNYLFTGKYEYRMRWGGEKIPGEINDTFRNFRIPDYRDLDGQRGQINDVRARDSKLFYWQDHSVGYAPILERQLVGGSALGDATALGITGVIDRYEDIDTYFGNQHQFGLTQTEYGFAWFDMRRRAFIVMGIGSKPEEVSLVKGLQVYFNNEFNEGNIPFPNVYSTVYNTNNLNIPEVPLLGYGIIGVYDPRFKMTYLTFKYNNESQDFSKEDFNESKINKDFTIGYNHILDAFVSFYDYCPAIWHNHNDLVLSSNNPKNTKAFNPSMLSTDFIIGDTVKYNNIEHICISPITIVGYPGTTTQVPDYIGSIYWLAINKENQIYLQTFGADLCKFYGKVWDHEIEMVIPFKTTDAVTAKNIQMKALGLNWSSIYASTDDQSSQDLNISKTNRNYRWIDKSWYSALPLPRNGRLTDYYIKIKFVYNNYVSNPTISKNIQKVSQFLKTFFEIRK